MPHTLKPASPLDLRHRERRLKLVVNELRAHTDARRSRGGRVPAPLGHALAEYEAELRDVRARLGSRHRRD
jgi:hypothetical protein